MLGCDAQFIIFVQDILTNGYHSNFAEPLIKKENKTNNNCFKKMKISIAEMVVDLQSSRIIRHILKLISKAKNKI